ncbi:integrase [Pantoea sp. Ap-967]|uniref:integrase n=1 Tax=Pantoea sp. Ap-967 TaxID=2608362 RepID=UPI00141FE344|nr:integrase [Pantoea sp. Ap-967]NIE77309.1 integrase [Pantoea sp. Ap-967]
MSIQRKKPSNSPAFPQQKAHLLTDVYSGMSLSRIGPGLVMSRSIEGNVISVFDDDEWFLPAFAYSVSDNPYFNFLPFRITDRSGESNSAGESEKEEKALKVNSENVATCKRLFTIKMFSNSPQTGKPMRLSSMQAQLAALRHLNMFALKNKLRILDIFGSKKIFEQAVSAMPTSCHRSFSGLIRTLSSLDTRERGFTIDGTILPFLKKIIREETNEGQQHPVMPSRILWAKYKQYNDCIKDYHQHSQAIYAFYNATVEDRFLGRGKRSRLFSPDEFAALSTEKKAAYIQDPPTFWKVVEKYKLTALAKKYNWRTIASIPHFLALVQHCAKCLIHLFTLMRDSEAINLPVDCLEPIRGWNNEALYVCGTSTKLERERTNAKWITTQDICKPVEVLQSIQKFVASHMENDADTDWLLLAASNLLSSKVSNETVVSRINYDKALPEVIITEADICELETIDPFRNWRDDKKFQIGKPWRVTSHQFRRSIAVFAGQSGLITLPSLKRLLRHITKVMSAYYMKGCSAKNYLFSDLNPQLTRELKRAKQEADAALYIRDVLKSAEQMYGFAGRRAMEMRKDSVWLPGTEEQTKRQVDLGLIAYEETPAGGCASLVPCDKRAHAKMDFCSSCKSFVGQEAKMAETIEIMEFDLAELQPGTIEYRAELQNLEDFKAMRDRVIARG